MAVTYTTAVKNARMTAVRDQIDAGSGAGAAGGMWAPSWGIQPDPARNARQSFCYFFRGGGATLGDLDRIVQLDADIEQTQITLNQLRDLVG